MSDLTFSEQNQILHHGVEGQKWGIRNGPPYPLNQNGAANRQDGSLFLLEVGVMLTGAMVKGLITNAYRKHKRLSNAKDPKNAITIRDCLANNEPVPRELVKKNTTITKKDLKKINSIGGTVNCTRCATTFILNKKGYNLQANNTAIGDNSQELYRKVFKSKPTMYGRKDENKLVSDLEKTSNGSYGAISFSYKGAAGAGHILNWAKENNKIVIYDAQPGTKMTYSTFIDKYGPDFSQKVYMFNTTDNEINWNEIVKNKVTL